MTFHKLNLGRIVRGSFFIALFVGVTIATVYSLIPFANPIPDRFGTDDDGPIYVVKGNGRGFIGESKKNILRWINADLEQTGRVWLTQAGLGRNRRGEITLWDVRTEQQTAVLRNPMDRYSLWSATLSPDKEILAGECIINSSRQGRHNAVVINDGMHIVLWDVTSGELLTELAGTADAGDVVFSPEGSRFLVSTNEQIHLYTVAKTRCMSSLDHQILDFPAEFRKRGRMFFTRESRAKALFLSQADEIQLWDVETNQLEASWMLSEKAGSENDHSNPFVLSPDRSLLAVAIQPNLVHLWSIDDKRYLGRYQSPGDRGIWPVFSPDNRFMVIMSSVRQPLTRQEEERLKHLPPEVREREAWRFEMPSPVADLIDLSNGKTWHDFPLNDCKFSDDSRTLIASTPDGIAYYSMTPSNRRTSLWAWFWLPVWFCLACLLGLRPISRFWPGCKRTQKAHTQSARNEDLPILDVLPVD